MISHEKCCQSYSDISPKRTQTVEKNVERWGCCWMLFSWYQLVWWLEIPLGPFKTQFESSMVNRENMLVGYAEKRINNGFCWRKRILNPCQWHLKNWRVLMVGWFSSGTFYHWTDHSCGSWAISNICNMYIVNALVLILFCSFWHLWTKHGHFQLWTILSHKPETVVGFHVDFQDLPQHRQTKSWASQRSDLLWCWQHAGVVVQELWHQGGAPLFLVEVSI